MDRSNSPTRRLNAGPLPSNGRPAFRFTSLSSLAALLGFGMALAFPLFAEEPLPALSVADVAVVEGDSGTVEAVFLVNLSSESAQDVTVDYATVDGTALAGTDYAAASGTLTFEAGQISQTVTVAITGDTVNEPDETFELVLSNVVHATLETPSATGTIQNDDPLPALSASDITVLEGNSGTVDAVFSVNLSAASGQEVSVDYATANGTATAGTDYAAASGTLTFAAGEISKTVTIAINGDALNEPDETFQLVLSNPTNASMGEVFQVTGTIENDDPLPALSIADVTVTEGDFGVSSAVFNVALSPASGQVVSVNYATANGTAMAGNDYIAASGSVSFEPGVTAKTITVAVNGDTIPEPDKTFFVNLSIPANATIQRGQGVARIVDNEARTASYTSSSIVIADYGPASSYPSTLTASGFPGTVIAVSVTLNKISHSFPSDIDVLLVGPSGQSVLLMSDAGGGGETPLDEVTLTFSSAAGSSLPQGQITSGVYLPTDYFPSDTFPSPAPPEPYGAALSAFLGTNPNGTWSLYINDDSRGDSGSIAGGWTLDVTTLASSNSDVGVTMTAAPNPVTVGRSLTYTITVTNSGPASTQPLVTCPVPGTVALVSATASHGSVTEANGFVFVSMDNLGSGQSATITIVAIPNTPGQVFSSVSVGGVSGDPRPANDSASTNVTVEPMPTLAISDTNVLEGDAGTVNAVFSVTLSRSVTDVVTVKYTTTNGSATAGSDYVATAGTVTFPPGSTVQSISVPVNGDQLSEPDEIFYVNLSDAVSAVLTTAQGVGSILNDDPVIMSISDVTVTEGNSGTVAAVFTVSLATPSRFTVSAFFSTADGTAAAASDYQGLSGTVSFAPGSTVQSISVTINGDNLNERDETFLVRLSNFVNAIPGNATATGTILNDDPMPALSVGNASVTEGNSGTIDVVFAVSLSAPSGQVVTVQYSTADSSATAGSDYFASSGTLTFPPGLTSQSIAVAVRGDLLNEADEIFFLNLANPVNATIGSGQGQGTIRDEDPVPAISINDVSVTEGNSGLTEAVFTIALSQVSGQSVTVGYGTADGTAVAGLDFVAASGTVTFPTGSTNQPLTIQIKGDTLPEPAESFVINLSAPVNGVLNRAQGTCQIIDDETITVDFSNANPLAIPLGGQASSYPSAISLGGLPGQISKATVRLNALRHSFPDDLDILLVAPSGQPVMLMSDAGGASALNGVNVTFEDAGGTLPDSGAISGGNYMPADYPPGDTLPGPAPSGPYGNQLSLLNGSQPNGTWSLYVFDDNPGDAGSLGGGWTLSLTLTNFACCSSGSNTDLSVTLSDSRDPAVSGSSLAYTATVINSGPGSASGVALTQVLPTQATFNSAVPSQGSFSRSGSTLNWSVGALAAGGVATLTVNVTPTVDGSISTTATVSGSQPDPNPSNNSASAGTQVILPPPTLSAGDTTVTEGNVTTTTAVFSVTLSRPFNEAVTVNYVTSGGSATSGIDFVAASGTLTFPAGTTTRTVSVVVNGDTVVEPNETFTLILNNPTSNATLAKSTGTATILNDDGVPGQVDHFNWAAIPSAKGQVPFNVTVTAVDPGNVIVQSFSSLVNLSGLVGTGASSSVLITEIDSDVDQVEFSNVSALPVDISGWQITAYDQVSWPDPAFNFVIPSGTTCPAGGVFILRDNGTYPGGYPDYFSGVNLFWSDEPNMNPMAVALRTATGQFVDFACAVDGFSSGISNPTSIPSSQWQGNPISAITDPSLTYQRRGSADQNAASDWIAAPRTVGAVNPGLNLPFPGPKPISVTPATSGFFVNGTWTGSITVLQAATNMYLKADDGNGHMGLSGTFNVSPPNQPPSISAIADQSTNEDVPTAAIPFTVADPDTPIGSLVIGKNSSDPVLIPLSNIVLAGSGTNRTVTIFPATNLFGSATITISATDGVSTNSRSFLLTVNPVNDPPVFTKGLNPIVLEDAGLQTIPGWASAIRSGPTNEAEQTFSFVLTNTVPALFAVQPAIAANGTLTFLTATNLSGLAAVTVQLRDNGGVENGGVDLSPPQTFTITVTPVNDPPVFLKGANLTVLEDAGPQTVPAWATGISPGPLDEAAQTLTFAMLTNSNPGLFATAPAIAPNGTLSYTTATNAHGAATIAVQLRDSGGTATGGMDASPAQSFTITVTPVNDVPVFTKGPDQTILQDAGSQTVTNWATAISPGPLNEASQTLTFVLTNSNPNLFIVQPAISAAGALSYTPATGSNGVATVSVQLRDSGGTASGGVDTSPAQAFTITVAPANEPPVLALIPNQAVNEGALLNVALTAADPNIPANTLAYSLVSGPAGMTVNAASGLLSWTPTEAQGPSTNVVTVKVTDDGTPPLSHSRTFTAVVNEVNHPPVLAAVANPTVNEGVLLSVPLSATDPDLPVNTLTYSLVSGPSGITVNGATGVLTWTPTEAQGPSTNVVTVKVTDNGAPALSDTRNFTVVVSEVNSAPVLAAVPAQSGNEGAPFSLPLSASDPDLPANTLTYSLTAGPAGMILNGVTGLLSWTPAESQGPSTNTISVKVTDSGTPPMTDTKSFTLVTHEVNSAPVLAVISNQTVSEGSLLSMTLSASDLDLPSNALAYSLVSGPVGMAVNSATGLLTWTPTEAQGPSTNAVTVRVTDNGVPPLSDIRTFTVVVHEVNSAPVLAAITSRTVNEGTLLSLTLSATDSDVPPNVLTYNLVSGPSGLAVNSATGALTWTPAEAQGPSTNVVTVKVSDHGAPSMSDTKTFTVVVNEVNTAPVLAAIGEKAIRALSTLSFDLGVNDADVPANLLSFSMVIGAAGASVDPSSGLFTWTPTLAQSPSTNTITVKVTDNGTPSLSDTKSFTVVVTESNSAPVLSVVPNQTLNEGTLLSVGLTGMDPDGPAEMLTYSLVSGPAGMTVVGGSGLLTWTPSETQGPSTNIVTVKVTDTGVPPLSDTRTFTVWVNEVNSAPVLAEVLSQSVNEGALLTVALSASDVDIPANTLSYTLASGPAGISLNGSTGLLSWTPTEEQGPSTNIVTVKVTDNGTPPLSDTKSLVMMVHEVNRPPVLAPVADRFIDERSVLSIALEATDPDMPSNRLSYALVSGPAGLTVDPSSGVIAWATGELNGGSTNLVTVRVSDNGLPPLVDTKTFAIMVREVNDPPVLGPVPSQAVAEGSTFALTVSATDPDVPADALTFDLLDGPGGATLSNAGVLRWPTAIGDGGRIASFTVRVTDNGVPPLSDTKTFAVTVSHVNHAPVLAAISTQTVAEGDTLNLSLLADDPDLPANALAYQLISGPAGMTLNALSGLLTWTPSETQGPGTNSVTVSVTDNGVPPLSDTQTFVVIVSEVNTAPNLPPIADKTVKPLSLLSFLLAASDGDVPANGLRFTLVSGPAGAALDSVTGLFTWTPPAGQGPSTNSFAVRVTDDGLPPLSDTRTFSVVVTESNSAPVMDLVPNQVIDELSVLRLTITAVDPDDPVNSLSYSLVAAPPGMTIDSRTGVLTWTPTEAQGPGTNLVTVQVADAGPAPLSDTRTFSVQVREVNSPPFLESVPDQFVNESATLALTLAATDADIPANTLAYSLVNGPEGLVLHPSSGTLAWTPSESQGPGAHTVTVRVTDDGVPPQEDTRTFNIIVHENNSAPVLAPVPDQTIAEGQVLNLLLSAIDADIPANTFIYTVVSGPAGMTIDPTAGRLLWTPTEAQGPSTSPVTVRVTDSGNPPLSATQSFTVRVEEVNRSPVLTAVADQVITEGSQLSLPLTASDPDVPVNNLTFSLVTGPPGATVGSSGDLLWATSLTDGGMVALFTIRVTDNGVPPLSDTQTFEVRVMDQNHAPTLAAVPSQRLSEGDTLNLLLAATDSDVPADALTYRLVSGPAGMTLNPVSGLLRWTPNEAQGPGTNLVTVQVTDDGTPPLSHSQSFTVIVHEVNTAPVMQPIADKTIRLSSSLSFEVGAADDDLPANRLTYSLVNGPAGAALDAATGFFRWTPTFDQRLSTNVVTFRVTDDGVPPLSDTRSFTVFVTESNSAPVLALVSNQVINESALLTLTLTATDPEEGPDALSYSLVSGPSGMTVTTGGTLRWTPAEAQGPDIHLVTVQVSDNGEPRLTDTRTFAITVKEVNSPPFLHNITDQTLDEGSPLTIHLEATDDDLPENTLAFSLATAPEGMNLNPSTGVLTWTPAEFQGPSTNQVTVQVTDNGTPPMVDTWFFQVIVREVNTKPVFQDVFDKVIRARETLTMLLAAADADLPPNQLSYSLISGPAGARLDADTGLFTWTPAVSQAFSTNLVTARVSDDGAPPLSETITFQIIVQESLGELTLVSIPPQTVNEGDLLVLANAANTSDFLAGSLSFSLEPGVPSGATIDPATGVFTWIPSESQGPSTNTITVRAMDAASQAAGAMTFQVVVNEVNSAPVLASIPDQTVAAGGSLALVISANDPDLPPNTLSYSLVSGPAGAAIHPTSGLLTWTPAPDERNVSISVRVTDNGAPQLSDVRTFQVSLTGQANAELQLNVRNNQIVLSWPSALAAFRIEFCDDLQPAAGWTALPGVPEVNGEWCRMTDSLTGRKRFYRLASGSAPTVPLLKISESGSNVVLSWSSTQAGFALEYKDQLAASAVWTPLPITPILVGSEFRVIIAPVNKARFYRLRQGLANGAPVLKVKHSAGKIILGWSSAAQKYSLFLNETLANGSAWRPVPTAPQLNGNEISVTLEPASHRQFFRLQATD